MVLPERRRQRVPSLLQFLRRGVHVNPLGHRQVAMTGPRGHRPSAPGMPPGEARGSPRGDQRDATSNPIPYLLDRLTLTVFESVSETVGRREAIGGIASRGDDDTAGWRSGHMGGCRGGLDEWGRTSRCARRGDLQRSAVGRCLRWRRRRAMTVRAPQASTEPATRSREHPDHAGLCPRRHEMRR